MAKKLYTGFESYWANRTADTSIPAADIANLYGPTLLTRAGGNPNALVTAEFNTTARTLTTKGAFSRGTYLNAVSSNDSQCPALDFYPLTLGGSTSMFMSFYAKYDNVNAGTLPGFIAAYAGLSADQGMVIGKDLSLNSPPSGDNGLYYVYDFTSTPKRLLIIDIMGGSLLAQVNLAAPLLNNTWYPVQIANPGNGDGAYFMMNGQACSTGAVTRGSNSRAFTLFTPKQFGGGAVAQFDDLCVNDTVGPVDNSLPPTARFFNATAQATAGTASGWSVVPSGPTPQAALIDGTDANTLKAFAPGAVVGEVLPDSGSLYPSAVRVLTINFSLKNVQRDSISAPALSTRVNFSGGNVDRAVGPALVQANQFVPTFYKSGTTEFTLADYDSVESQLITT